MFKKTDKSDVYKDMETGAVINKNDSKLTAYKKQKRFMNDVRVMKHNYENLMKEHEEILSENNSIRKELNSLKKEVKSLKEKVK
jgi:peptidoglycan hydrolase CwlO-like protein